MVLWPAWLILPWSSRKELLTFASAPGQCFPITKALIHCLHFAQITCDLFAFSESLRDQIIKEGNDIHHSCTIFHVNVFNTTLSKHISEKRKSWSSSGKASEADAVGIGIRTAVGRYVKLQTSASCVSSCRQSCESNVCDSGVRQLCLQS